MKKKSLNIVLLIAVGVVWYLIIDTIIDHFKTDDSSISTIPTVMNEQKDLSPTDESIFHNPLTFQNKSPFVRSRLNESQTSFIAKSGKAENRINEQSGKDENQLFDEIKYIGLIKNPGNKVQIGLVDIGGKLFQVEEKSIVRDSIKISSMNDQNIIIQISNKTKTIYKSQD